MKKKMEVPTEDMFVCADVAYEFLTALLDSAVMQFDRRSGAPFYFERLYLEV